MCAWGAGRIAVAERIWCLWAGAGASPRTPAKHPGDVPMDARGTVWLLKDFASLVPKASNGQHCAGLLS